MEKYGAAAKCPTPFDPNCEAALVATSAHSRTSRLHAQKDYDLTGLSLPNAVHVTHRFPVDGEYVIRVFLGGVRPAASEPLQLALWIDNKQVQTLSFDPEGIASFSDDRQDFGGMTQEFRVRLTAGDHWVAASILRLYEGLPPKYGGPNPSKRPAPQLPEFKPRPTDPPERTEMRRKRFEAQRAEKVPVNEAASLR